MNRGWLSSDACVTSVKRTVYLLGLPFGATSALLLLWLEHAQGTLHIVDRFGLPLLALLLLVLTLLFWRRRGQFFVLELLLFGGVSLMLLASFVYSIFQLPTTDVVNLTGLGYWTTVLFTLAFLIFGVRTGLRLSLGVYLLALGVWVAEIVVGSNSSVIERTILFQLYAANGLQLFLLYAFGLLVQLQTQQAARLERDANTDVLTSLPNRRFLQAQLEAEFERATRYQRTFSVALLDIDHFKGINDTFGHPVGDEILREVGQLLQAQARTLDTTGRWGGEEFLLLLPELPLKSAGEVAERFRTLIGAYTFAATLAPAAAPAFDPETSSTASPGVLLTVSLGVAEFRQGETLADLLARADRALYDAKTQGRNRVMPEPTLY